MFGILYTLGLLGVATVDGIKGAFENAEKLQKGYDEQQKGNNIAGVYFDRRGAMRDLKTGKIASISIDYGDPCDDKWLFVGEAGIKTKNISEEKRRIEFLEGKNGDWLGRTTDIYDSRHWSHFTKNRDKVVIIGSYYADLRTDDIYVCRSLPIKTSSNTQYCKFYMDILTGYLVRKSDTQYEYEKKNPNSAISENVANAFMETFNKAQKNGGWYHGDPNRFGNAELLRKQDFYCDKFECSDHIYNLVTVRGNAQKDKDMVNNTLYKEVRKL